MAQGRWRGGRGLAVVIVAAVALALLWARPVPARPVPPQPTRASATARPVATRVPAPAPLPTRPSTGLTPPWHGTRGGIPAPVAPELLVGASAVVNVLCVGDCTYPGAASWLTADTRVGWTTSDPVSSDYYEVWRSAMEPYFDPATCQRCSLAGTTTGLEFVVPDAPPGFNPVGGTAGASSQSDLVFFRVRAANAGGPSSLSNEIGAVNYSLLQGAARAAPN